MSTMDKALQVGTLIAVSLGILACAPQKNANILPVNSVERFQLTKMSVPTTTIKFASANSVQLQQPDKSLIAQKSLSASEANVNGDRPVVHVAKRNQVTQLAEQQDAPQLQQTQPMQQTQQLAPKVAYNFYGNPNQPGYQIQMAIFALFEQGIGLDEAAQQVINLVINQNQVISDALAMSAVAEQPNLSVAFVLDIAQITALIDATKLTIEKNPGQLNSIILLGVTLYPDYTRDIISAATLTGEITEEQAILLAIAAGADPTLLANSTAAGTDGPGLSAFAAAPLGSGVGAGGTGGGDSTASTN